MSRFKQEKQAIRELEDEVSWLTSIGWAIGEKARLVYRFEFKIEQESIPLTLQFGYAFPSAPPTIFPDPPRQLSRHQYGSGDLCLEFGPDTWLPEVSGADLVRSAFGLLSREINQESDPAHAVESRHRLTVGQAARNKRLRFMLTAPVSAVLQRAQRNRVGDAHFKLLYNDVSAVFVLVGLDGFEEQPWKDQELPPSFLKTSGQLHGAVVTISGDVVLP